MRLVLDKSLPDQIEDERFEGIYRELKTWTLLSRETGSERGKSEGDTRSMSRD